MASEESQSVDIFGKSLGLTGELDWIIDALGMSEVDSSRWLVL